MTTNSELCPSANLSSSQELVAAEKKRTEKLYGTIFLTSVAGGAALFGFGMTLAMAKRKDPNFFSKGLFGNTKEVPESGGSLALRALGWGTFYAVSGFSAFCYCIWKAMGVKDLQEFRLKAGNALPRIPKSENQGRTEFSGLNDLIQYIIDEDKKKKDR
ncbi:Transmembrane protein [Halotydeus destructor]|nr:Transmembrane protein [Halotydeus destructor]